MEDPQRVGRSLDSSARDIPGIFGCSGRHPGPSREYTGCTACTGCTAPSKKHGSGKKDPGGLGPLLGYTLEYAGVLTHTEAVPIDLSSRLGFGCQKWLIAWQPN